MKLNKIISAILSISLLSGTCAVKAENKIAFEDIENHWAENDITFLYNAGIVSGVSETEFRPDDIIDKAQFITMLVRALGISPDIYSVSYSDVFIRGDWYAGYLGGAVNAGIIENSMNPFNPMSAISRGDTAKMLYNAVVYTGLDDEMTVVDVNYSDIDSEDEELQKAVSTVSTLGIMVGDTETTFSPDGNLTRAEAAAVVKRMAIASSSVEEVTVISNFSSAEDGTISLDGSYSYAEFGYVDFHYGITKMSLDVQTLSTELELEVWIDGMDALTGSKIASIKPETIGSGYRTETATINKISGSHKVFVRLIGNGAVSVKNLSFTTDELKITPSEYTKIENAKKSGTSVTALKWGSAVDYGEVDFSDGYDTVEFTFKDSVKGQYIEVQLDGEKQSLIETVDSAGENVTVSMPISGASGKRNLVIKPLSSIDGYLTNIRFYNNPGKADLYLGVDKAQTELEITESNDYLREAQTSEVHDGDIIAFKNVNFDDGYNFLTMRVKNTPKSSIAVMEGNNQVASVMELFSNVEDACFEIRLDTENGPLIGVLRPNQVFVNTEFDTQSCRIYNATGIHDLYLKAVGNIGWNVCYVKLQERGYYDIPFITLEAEEMTVNEGIVTNPSDSSRYTANTIESESSGKSTVKIVNNSGYIEFKIPEWFDGENSRTRITVRNSISDKFDDKNWSIGQTGKMRVSVNGTDVKLINTFTGEREDDLTLTNQYSIGYGNTYANGSNSIVKGEYASFFYDDASGVIEGDLKPGDTIRLKPEINDDVTYCYIDCVDIENIPEMAEKPESFLSITDCGAVANDGLDDAEALRAAIQKVKDAPYTYAGIWIPNGQFDMLKYENNYTAANFTGLRVMGAGMYYSLLQNYDQYADWTASYAANGDTMLHNFALQGNSIQRGFSRDGKATSAIAISGNTSTEKPNVMTNLWLNHWNAGLWLRNATGVYYKLRLTNMWADGINVHGESDAGVIYEKFYSRGNGDDALAIFSVSEDGLHVVKNVTIKHNSVVGTWWAAGIGIWGIENGYVHHNHVTDSGLGPGIALNGWGFACPGSKNLLLKNNRIERSGNFNTGNQYTAAIQIVPGSPSQYFTTEYEDVCVENNECIDNPTYFMRVSSAEGAGSVEANFRYNYVRNLGLGYPSITSLVNYRTEAVKGAFTYMYNIFEGNFTDFKKSNTKDVVDTLVGNIPDNWHE